jgi:hypothetical protein
MQTVRAARGVKEQGRCMPVCRDSRNFCSKHSAAVLATSGVSWCWDTQTQPPLLRTPLQAGPTSTSSSALCFTKHWPPQASCGSQCLLSSCSLCPGRRMPSSSWTAGSPPFLLVSADCSTSLVALLLPVGQIVIGPCHITTKSQDLLHV